jgi:hypothetical protein
MVMGCMAKLMGNGADPGEMLHEIECDPFGLKKGLRISGDGKNSSVCGNPISIALMKFYCEGVIDLTKDFLGNPHAGDNHGLFCHDLGFGNHVRRKKGAGC